MPLARAENLKRFGEHFGAMELRRLQVTVDDVIAAGMVAVPQKCCGVFSYCVAPNNPWAQCGGLLTNKNRWSSDVASEIARQMMALPGSMVCLDWMLETKEWN